MNLHLQLRGFSGYNSRWARKLLPWMFPLKGKEDDNPLPVSLLLIFFGANDAIIDGSLLI
jgi:hypothetical protein